ncbi:hypothetical protein CLV84_3137 [Neolewinella xylanilytica]|uniref:Uncharacterized protein n=1 Tax=Neolewinella xylanilytica TaxID=1514080 RepID=A0A2S6I4Z2_9BACT|nr:hypothetical protein CLV84_3137 [Neolewinella xylanilytica]
MVLGESFPSPGLLESKAVIARIDLGNPSVVKSGPPVFTAVPNPTGAYVNVASPGSTFINAHPLYL